MVVVLELAKKEDYRSELDVYKASDGTVFYWRKDSPQRLWVSWEGEDKNAELPPLKLNCLGDCENVVYFSSSKNIYTAVFYPSQGIAVSFSRRILGGETVHQGAVSSEVRNGKTYVYRLCDDPLRDGILVDIPAVERESLILLGVHRGKAVYVSQGMYRTPTVRELGKTAIVLQLIHTIANLKLESVHMFASDSSPFIYIECSKNLFVLDTETMKFLPHLLFGDIDAVRKIIDLRNGMITVSCRKGLTCSVMTSQLPHGYFVERPIETTVVPTAPPVEEPQNNSRTSSLGNQGSDDRNKIIEELVDSVEKLQAEIKEKMKLIAQEQSSSRQGPLCVICIDRTPNIIFLDCKHLAVCEQCLTDAASKPSTLIQNCPTCRKAIKSTMKIFV